MAVKAFLLAALMWESWVREVGLEARWRDRISAAAVEVWVASWRAVRARAFFCFAVAWAARREAVGRRLVPVGSRWAFSLTMDISWIVLASHCAWSMFSVCGGRAGVRRGGFGEGGRGGALGLAPES